ncbi:MAG TPA: GNAT family N-acetyltransferase [Thermoanaerobaculia bacterium]
MLNPEHWDRLTAGKSLFLSRQYLSLLRDHAPPGVRLHVALVYRDGNPVAAIAAQSLCVRQDQLRPETEARARKRERALRRTMDGLDHRVLVCGNLLSSGSHGLAFADDAEPQHVWPGVTEALYRLRRAERLAGETDLVLLKDLPTGDDVASAALHPYSYRPFETEPDMVLHLDDRWASFDDYLASLRKDYRKAIKNTHKQIDDAGISVQRLAATEVEAEAAALHRLYLNVQEAQSFRLVTLPSSYLPAMARAFQENFITTGLRAADGRLVGFVTTLRDHEGAVAYYIGYDKQLAASGTPLYLRLLQCVVEDAIAARATSISFGRTALEPKARLGAEPRGLRCFVRHRIEPMNIVVRGLIDIMPEPDLPPERHPFK